MKNSSRISKVFVALVFLFAQLTNNLSLASNSQLDITEQEKRTLLELYKTFPPGTSFEFKARELEINGRTVYSRRFVACPAVGKCESIPAQTYRTVDVYRTIDGHTVLKTQQADRIDNQPMPIGFSTMTWEISADKKMEIDLKTLSKIDLNPQSDLYRAIAPHLPAIANGVENTIQNYNQISETSKALQDAYKNALQQTAHAADGRLNQAQQREAASKLRSGIIAALTAPMIVDPKDIQQSLAYNEYQKSINDPYSFKEYDLAPQTQVQYENELKQAIQNKQHRTAIERARVLFNQRNQQHVNRAKKDSSNHFNDGVIQTTSFDSEISSPLDKAHFASKANSPGGQALRNTANKAQALWIETDSLSRSSEAGVNAYLLGSATLRSADEYFAAGDMQNGYELNRLANGLFDLTNGIGRGLTNNLSNTAAALPMLANVLGKFGKTAWENPEEGLMMAGEFLESVPGLAQAMIIHQIEMMDKLATGTAAERGEVIGEMAGDFIMDWISQGSLRVVKRGAQAAQMAERAGRLSVLARRVATEGLEKSRVLAKQFAGPRAKALVQMARHRPRVAIETVQTITTLTYKGKNNAADFIGRAMTGKSTYLSETGDAAKIASIYEKVEAGLINVSPSSIEVEVTRGIPKKINVHGKWIENSIEDVFKSHDGMRLADGRFSIGGNEGIPAIYTSMGKSEKVMENILSETNLSSGNIIYDSKTINLGRILDLSSSTNLDSIGIQSKDLLTRSGKDAYLNSQAIGHAAYRNGFDAIVSPSAMNESIKNVIIFIKD